MNIFVLDQCPIISAQSHFDKHVVKMVVESAQILSTAHRVLDGVRTTITKNNRKTTTFVHDNEELYKSTHVNHPSVQWCMKSIQNYKWVYAYFKALCEEYTFRYGKQHATEKKLLNMLLLPPTNIKDIGQTPFVLAFKNYEHCVVLGNPIQSYRNYYMTKQESMNVVWTNRQKPEWYELND